MKKSIIYFSALVAVSVFFTSCSSSLKTMREPNTRVNFEKKDFTLSEQVSAEATTTRILMIDFKRLFNKQSGEIIGGPGSLIPVIPVVGGFVMDQTQGYALHNLMKNNQGYDVVFYPQYETKIKRPILGLGFIFNKITVKTTARLGKLN